MRIKQGQKESSRTRTEDLSDARKQIVQLFLLSLAVLFVIAVVSLAWFSDSLSATAKGMTVSLVQDGFELRSGGDQEISPELKAYLDGSMLCWKLSADCNMENYGTQKGLHPNSDGTLTLYAIPGADGDLTLNCSLGIIPQMREADADAPTVDTATKILRGHILFACEYSYEEGGISKESKALVPVDGGEFTIHIPDAKAQEEYLIRLKWFWPYTLKDANNHAEYGTEIASLTNNQSFSENFYYRGNGSEAVDVNSAFKILNQRYNDADQFIGDNVDAVVLVLTADMER